MSHDEGFLIKTGKAEPHSLAAGGTPCGAEQPGSRCPIERQRCPTSSLRALCSLGGATELAFVERTELATAANYKQGLKKGLSERTGGKKPGQTNNNSERPLRARADECESMLH